MVQPHKAKETNYLLPLKPSLDFWWTVKDCRLYINTDILSSVGLNILMKPDNDCRKSFSGLRYLKV